jgi:cyclophilin family peptidyl-prolyl cis-trans isomerase
MTLQSTKFLLSTLSMIAALMCAPILAMAEEAPATTEKQESTDTKKAEKKETSDKKKAEKKVNSGGSKMTTVVIDTSMGKMEVELDSEKAPLSVENFLKYVDKKHYDGTIFHRVIKDFMIQGGGMDEKMNEKSTMAPIKNEAQNGLKNLRGTLAMARTGVVDSATSQFFINTVDNGFLDFRSPDPRGYGYAVFGKVSSGLDVVDKIRAVETGSSGMHSDVPKKPVVINSIKRK